MSKRHYGQSRPVPATFYRGGTSKALLFNDADLPPSREERDALFLSAMGSPDPNGRQLDGMGGGYSSVSKVAVVGKSEQGGADVDYTFCQVRVDEPVVDYAGNCGNMLAVSDANERTSEASGRVRRFSSRRRRRRNVVCRCSALEES